MGYKFSIVFYCCILILSSTVVNALTPTEIVYIEKEAPDHRFIGTPEDSSEVELYSIRQWRLHYLTGKSCVVRHKIVFSNNDEDIEEDWVYVYYQNGITSQITGIILYGDFLRKVTYEIYFIKPIKSRGSPVTVKYGKNGAQIMVSQLYSYSKITQVFLNPRVSLDSVTPSDLNNIIVNNHGVIARSGANQDFTAVFHGTDDSLFPKVLPVTVNFIYDSSLADPDATVPGPHVPGTKTKTNDGRDATVINDRGDIITDDGTVIGVESPLNPSYEPVADGGSNTTVPSDTIKPSDSTATTTENDTPSYDGEDPDTGAVVGAVGALSDNMTNSLNNLSSDVTNALNSLSATDADGFNGVIGTLNNLIDSANINASLERNKLQELIDAVNEKEDEDPEDPGEPPDLVVSDKTTNKPSFSDLFSSVAGFDVGTSSPPVFSFVFPRLGGLDPQLITLDFADIPFLDWFPLIRSILSWTLIIFTIKHIFDIFTGG